MNHVEFCQGLGCVIDEGPYLRRHARARRDQVHRVRVRLVRLQQAHQLPRPDIRCNLVPQNRRYAAARPGSDNPGVQVVDGQLQREATEIGRRKPQSSGNQDLR